MENHGDTREETVTDQRLVQKILNKVPDRLKEVYLLQRGQNSGAARTVMPGDAADPGNGPERLGLRGGVRDR